MSEHSPSTTGARRGGIVFYNHHHHIEPARPSEPLGIAVLTSLRDVAGDDHNGRMIRTRDGERYMEGAVERLVRETREGGRLQDLARLSAVITDDREKDMQKIGLNFPLRPRQGEPWIHPLDLRTYDDRLVAGKDMTHSVPSRFRSLPLSAVDERIHAKREFERRILQIMDQQEASILISDHYMAQIDHMIDDVHGRAGCVLNIHPAVTVAGHPHCLRGPTPTRDVLERARSGEEAHTGATLHFVNSSIDDGQPIAYRADTAVHAGDDPLSLKERNYRHAKLPVLIEGLRHYILRVYPHLERGTIPSLTPDHHVSVQHA